MTKTHHTNSALTHTGLKPATLIPALMLALLSTQLLACGDVAESDEAEGSDTAPAFTEATGECTVAQVDHSAACDEGCPITVDVRMRCDSSEFADPGLGVAPSADDEGVYLVTSGSDHAWLASFYADGSSSVEPLPETFARNTHSIAQSPSGTLSIGADLTRGANYLGGVTYYEPLSPGATEELVFDNPEKYTSVSDLEFDSDGVPHIWFLSDAPDERTHAWKPLGGEWQTERATLPGDSNSGWGRFTIATDRSPVAFNFDRDSDDGWSLWADGGDGPFAISSSLGRRLAWASPVPPPMPALEVEGPRFAIFSQYESSFRVSAPNDDGGYDEILIASEPALTLSCTADYDDGTTATCPAQCDELATGLDTGMVAVSRTSDGRWWAAWAVTTIDQTLTFEEDCHEDIGCWCARTGTLRDDSRGELVLAELDFATGETHEVLRLDSFVPNPSAWYDANQQAHALDMRAFGDQLALGVRVASTSDEIRVLRIDTNLIDTP
ncbi:MAG: hypothetical protein AAFX99_24520 [Myxococcota bacterium]